MALDSVPHVIHGEFERIVSGGAAKAVLVIYTDLDLDPSSGDASAVAALIEACKPHAAGGDLRLVTTDEDEEEDEDED